MTDAGSPVRSVQWVGPDRRVVVVAAAGDIDLHRSADFQRSLLELTAHRPEQVIVDLSGVPYMDSSGLASLVKLLARLEKAGIKGYTFAVPEDPY